ncbi:MAG TPA: DEAD/DEAH box helicase [Chlamydiales bacterium]|nr:DEAD/DEAH box helicase [Chlamydiales bacterium]
MKIPSFLKKHQKKAEELMQENPSLEVIFSEGTYQIGVMDCEENHQYWPFIQLNDQFELEDCFCTCSEAEKSGNCPHLLIAYKKIFSDGKPLHELFHQSFFYQLFLQAFRTYGDSIKQVQEVSDGSFAVFDNFKKVFEIRSKEKTTYERLDEIIKHRQEETEETSIKFSNMTYEEIDLWKKGKAKESFRFELSFWSDIAKWLFLKTKNNETFQVIWENDHQKLPEKVGLIFDDLEIYFDLPIFFWPEVIPTLYSVPSSLKVYLKQSEISDLIFDKEKNCFLIQHETRDHQLLENAITVGDWYFVPEDGFFPKQDSLLKNKIVSGNQINQFLKDHHLLVQEKLIGIAFDPLENPLQYDLFIDEYKRFHIEPYLFEKGDLLKKFSHFYGDYAYVEGRGFFKVSNIQFEGKPTIISEKDVSAFVTKHRLWLHQFNGFSTHLQSFESKLTYSYVNEELVFSSKVMVAEDFLKVIDYGKWYYLKGQGFYQHGNGSFRHLMPGQVIAKNRIAQFIKEKKEDLEQLSHFFLSFSPITERGLEVSINENGMVVCRPKIKLQKNIRIEDLEFFDDVVYLKGQGFYILGAQKSLPEGYTQEKIVSKREENLFVFFELSRLQSFIIEIDPKLEKPKHLSLQLSRISKEEKRKKHSWLADIMYMSEKGVVNAIDLWRAIKDKKKYLFSEAGLIFLNQPRFNWLHNLGRDAVHRRRKLLKLSTIEWIRLFLFEEIETPKGHSEAAKDTRKLLSQLQSFSSDISYDLSLLDATLRPYQEIGMDWLWFLYCHGLSGLLCDDMGLGKTHQSMALLAAIMKEDMNQNNQYLIICPTSVIYHWQQQLEKFIPSAKVFIYHGHGRDFSKCDESYQIILTTYGIIRNEEKLFSEKMFELAIFDELQVAKNSRSKTFSVLKKLVANMRLGLSGTPIENNLSELKALMDIVMPRFLPSDKIFKEMFIDPIEKEQDADRKLFLARLIKPFILRRNKSEVLLDLPEKTEEIVLTDLSRKQEELYNEVLSMQKQLIQSLKDEEKPISYTHIFALLTKLKQICDHPSLYLKELKEPFKNPSGKWDLFVDLLHETLESGQKLVVFSQYVEMLSIMERYFHKKGIGYAKIQGSTLKRHLEIKRFKEDPSCKVFLGSLLAAGVGIDLSNASVVIHYDRWWNPAKENQATDRVHRIGQTRGVLVFKFVTKNTIEERIDFLIEKKKGLIDEIAKGQGNDPVQYLSRDELVTLLKEINIYE